MNSERLKSVYFLGIGGIGMSALARYFLRRGAAVYGYDKTPSRITELLEQEGAHISFDSDPAQIPASFLALPFEEALVVYTPAIPVDHEGMAFLKSRGYLPLKRAELLAHLVAHMRVIAVAGTHGKTTTTAMIAHLLHSAAIPVNAFMGGIALNFDSNIHLDPEASYAVVEADEYDRSFLRLRPYVGIITSADADHLDIYGHEAELQKSFASFANAVHADGALLLQHSLKFESGAAIQKYGIDAPQGLTAKNIRFEQGWMLYDVWRDGTSLGSLRSSFPGKHNVENSLAAVALGMHMGISWEKIAEAVSTFAGVKRRFEYKIREEKRVFIDDYAHHPTEINACVGAVRELYPDRSITGVFQPHLYSRTRDFMDEFARSLEGLNALLLMEIYPAREAPIAGVSSSALLDKIQNVNKKLVQREKLVDEIVRLDPEVVLTMGAGDIDRLVDPIAKALREKDE